MHHILYQTQNTALMNMKTLMAGLTALLLLCASCAHGTDNEEPQPEPVQVVTVDTTESGLVIYYPPTDSIALQCFNRPDPKVDNGIVLCCAAAFTADWKSDPDHDRICGDHVSEGKFYQRPRITRNTGAFVTWDGTWRFLYHKDADQKTFRPVFKQAAAHGGAAFTQEMMIHQGEKVRTTRPASNVNQFRALAQIGDRLCIADGAAPMKYGDFIQALLDAGATEAIYMDMGPGWNYSWYREYADSSATWIHSATLSSATNWLVFCQK